MHFTVTNDLQLPLKQRVLTVGQFPPRARHSLAPLSHEADQALVFVSTPAKSWLTFRTPLAVDILYFTAEVTVMLLPLENVTLAAVTLPVQFLPAYVV